MLPVTTDQSICPQCGTPVGNKAPEGLCPRCVAALSLQGDTGTGAGDDRSAAPSLTPEELAPFFPHLEILECLGRGGMGVVYKARQKSLNRLVAVKLLAPERVWDAKFAQRFAQEAQALAALSHPNIVTVHEFGQADGIYFLLMEFVDGVSLRQAMKGGRFTPEQALGIVPPVCEALQYAHEHGVVHRDIKPENLLIDKHGRVKIADFGIAKMLHAEGESLEAEAAGTPPYMAPEQKAHRATDSRADIYSLGVVLYELLTGELPAGKLELNSGRGAMGQPLNDLMQRALHENPEMRYQTAADLRDHLETILISPDRGRRPGRGGSIGGRTSFGFESVQPPRSGFGKFLLAGGLILAVVVFAIIKLKPAPQGQALASMVDMVDFNSGALTDSFFVNVQTGKTPYTLVPGIGLGGSPGVAHHNADVSKDATLVYKAKGFDLSTLDSLEASCFVRKRSVGTIPGTGPLFIGLVGTNRGFLGGYDDESTSDDAFALARLTVSNAAPAPWQWRLGTQSKLGNTTGVVRPSEGEAFTPSDGHWYQLRATFKRIDDKTLQIAAEVLEADAQGKVGAKVARLEPALIAVPDLASHHQVWVALRGFGTSGADVWDNFSIAARGVEPGVPAAPTLSARGLDAYRATLSWKDQSTNEDSFIVSRATAPGGPYTDLATLAANTTTYIDRAANRLRANYYQVRAASAAGTSVSGEIAVPAYDPPYRWENVAIGGGGAVTGIFLHPREPGLIYLRTDQGGFYRWDPAQTRWVAITDHLTMADRNWYGGQGLALDPQNPDIVYIACGRFAGPNEGPGALFKSTDRGANWTKLPLEGIKMGARESKRGAGERLVVSPHDSNVLFFASLNDGLWRSLDAGASWAQAKGFPGPGIPLIGITAVAFDPHTAGVVYAALYGDAVYRSADQGVTWTRLEDGPDQVNRLTVSSTGDLFAAHQYGVAKYSGGSWKLSVPGEAPSPLSGLSVNPANPRDILVAEGEADTSKIYRSLDAGDTWALVPWTSSSTLPWFRPYNLTMSHITALEFDPSAPDRVWLIDRYGIWRADHLDAQPVSFINEEKGHEHAVVLALASPAAGAELISGLSDLDGFRHDNGLNLPPSRRLGTAKGYLQDTYGLAVFEGDPARLVRCAGNRGNNFHVLTSEDGGATWASTSWGKSVPRTMPLRVAISATDPANFVVIADGNTAQVTIDNGATWQPVNGLPGGLSGGPWVWTQPLAADRQLGGTFYYFDGFGGVHRSTDQGRNFARTNSATLPSHRWSAIKTLPGTSRDVWVSLDTNGLYRSTDGGTRFSRIPNVRRAYLFAFGKSAPGKTVPALYLYGRIGESTDGLYRSLDLGATWTELTDPRVAMGDGPSLMEASAQTYGLVFIGTNARGIYMGRPIESVKPVSIAPVDQR